MTLAPIADRFAAISSQQRIRLLRRLVEADRLADIPAVVPPHTGGEPVRLSPAQEALWTYEELYPGTSALNLSCAYHFDHGATVDDLERALSIVVANHDVLRMRITGGVADRRVEFPPAGRFRLERLKTAGDTGAALTAFGRRPFDLSRGRLFRGAYLPIDDTHASLVLAMHHIVGDWWSFDVLHTEFVSAYRAVRDAAAAPPGRPRIQYADFAGWQRELESAGVFDAHLRFWRDYLTDLPEPLTAPGARAEPDGTQPGFPQVPFHIDGRTETAVRRFAAERGGTTYAVLMAAFAVLTHRLTGRDDFVLGTPMANRDVQGLERLLGYVMNTVPTRWRVAADDTFATVLDRYVTVFPALLARADVPVGQIVSAVDPRRRLGHAPLYQWLFMHLPRQPSSDALERTCRTERIETGGEHDLVCVVRDGDDGFEGALAFRSDRYSEAQVRGWAAAFTELLPELLANPDAPVGAGPAAGPAPQPARELVALPASPGHRPPGTARERLLCGLFAEATGRDRVGADEDLFELGADSITAILLVGRARAAGVAFSTQDVFLARTPARLAQAARDVTTDGDGGEDGDEGRFPPTPVMLHWLTSGAPLDALLLPVRFPVRAGLDEARVARALRLLIERHATLRLRLIRNAGGAWELEVPVGEPLVDPELTRVPAAEMTDAEVGTAADAAAAALRLDPIAGRIVAAVWYDRGPRHDGQLLLAVHHLAVDGVSMRLLRQDLGELLTAGRNAATLSAVSFRRWTRTLQRRAAGLGEELPRWLEVLRTPDARLAPGRADAGPRRAMSFERPAGPVLASIPAALHCGPGDVLLAALLAAALRWRGAGTRLLVAVEGHGRDTPAGGPDLAGVVGCFTTQYPVRLDAGRSAAEAFWQGGAAAGSLLTRVRDQLRRARRVGPDYGLLRHLNQDTAAALAAVPEPDIGFNYLGRFTDEELGDGPGPLNADGPPAAHLVELDVVAEADRLVATLSYPAGSVREDEIRRLGDLWFAALDVLVELASGDRISTAFPLVDLTDDQLDALAAGLDDADGGARW